MDETPEVARAGGISGFGQTCEWWSHEGEGAVGCSVWLGVRSLGGGTREAPSLCVRGVWWAQEPGPRGSSDVSRWAAPTPHPWGPQPWGLGLLKAADPVRAPLLSCVFSADAVFLFWSHVYSVGASYSKSIAFSSFISAILRKHHFPDPPPPRTALVKRVASSFGLQASKQILRARFHTTYHVCLLRLGFYAELPSRTA